VDQQKRRYLQIKESDSTKTAVLLKKNLLAFLFLWPAWYGFAQKVAHVDLYVGDTIVTYSGKKAKALAINGQIPAPVLEFTEGDTAEIVVHNLLETETSIHWHGIILPNRFDGVPYLTTSPVKPGQCYTYRFALKQNGTYWYHSHTQLQEQSGLYGAFIIHPKKEPPQLEYTLLLSDWTDERPANVHHSLHNANDWYAIRKGSTQSYGEAIRKGYFKTKLKNEWKRMLAMDVSDVYYNRFLTNGKSVDEQPKYKKGDRVRLRIVNGSSSTYFWLRFSGGPLQVIANDGMEVEPMSVDRMLIAVAETYDVVVTIPADGSYELMASAEDRTKSTSLWMGSGERKPIPALPGLNYFEGMKMMNGMMKMNGSMDAMGMQMSNQSMDMNTVMYPEMSSETVSDTAMAGMSGMKPDTSHSASVGLNTLNYGMLRSLRKTTLNGPVRTFRFELTGNMNRYVWAIDNKTVSETDKILIHKGEVIRIVLYNGTMMRHPMHLHGHFFRVLNGQGDYAPLKNVLDIMPMETDTLEFAASESGDWYFHCHILYHMMSGMGRIFSYADSPANPDLPNPQKALRKVYRDDRRAHFMARIGLESNGSDGELMLSNTRYRLQTEWRLGMNTADGYESESHIGRYIGKMQFLLPYIGWDYRYRTIQGELGRKNTKDNRQVLCAGVQYTLPLLVVADVRIDMAGKWRFQLMREDIAISPRLRFGFMVNSDKEYMAGFRYILNKYVSLSTHYDSDMGIGAGISIRY
jgi:CopA family copper-resistance protein